MCRQCEKNPVYEFTNQRKLCKNCFIRYFQKKVFYVIRKFEMIKKNDILGYVNKGYFRDVVLEEVLEVFSRKAHIELIKLPSKKRIIKKAISSTIDLSSDYLIHEIIKGNIKNLKNISPIDKKMIKPLYLFLDEEVLLYAKLKKLKFKKVKEKNQDKISSFIEVMEKKHPEIKHAVINSYLEIFH